MSAERPERIVVAATGGPEGQGGPRGAAGSWAGARGTAWKSLLGDRLGPRGAPDWWGWAGWRGTTEDRRDRHHTIKAGKGGEGLLHRARGNDATQRLVGAPRCGRGGRSARGGVREGVVADSGDIDVLMVSHPYARGATDPQRSSALSPRRRVTGWALALAGPVLLTLLLQVSRNVPTSQALAFLALTVLVALVGGLWPAVVAAVLGSVLLNYFFTAPVHTLNVENVDNVVALVLFVVVAVAVASVVDVAARRAVQADRARREADALSRMNRALLRTEHGVGDLLDLVRETFTMTAATLLRAGQSAEWSVVALRGDAAPVRPEDADAEADASHRVNLLLRGRPLPPQDLRVLGAFATHLAVVLDRTELAAQAAEADRLEQGNRMRTALLAAVSHDLRTPLAGIKAAVSTLRTPDVTWTPESRPTSSARSRTPPTGSPRSSRTCWTSAGCRPAASPWSATSSASTTWCRGPSPGCPRGAGCSSTFPRTCPRSASTPACSTGSSRTSSTTPCGTRTVTSASRPA